MSGIVHDVVGIEDWEDEDRRNKSGCGKHKREHQRSETEMVGSHKRSKM